MHPDEKKRLDDAIHQGLDDIEAGRGSDFGEFLEELKKEDRRETPTKGRSSLSDGDGGTSL